MLEQLFVSVGTFADSNKKMEPTDVPVGVRVSLLRLRRPNDGGSAPLCES